MNTFCWFLRLTENKLYKCKWVTGICHPSFPVSYLQHYSTIVVTQSNVNAKVANVFSLEILSKGKLQQCQEFRAHNWYTSIALKYMIWHSLTSKHSQRASWQRIWRSKSVSFYYLFVLAGLSTFAKLLH